MPSESAAPESAVSMPVVETHDFGAGSVPAHRHIYGGGWVADIARVDDSAYVGPFAVVYGRSVVKDNASIQGSARVYGASVILEDAKILGYAEIIDSEIGGSAYIDDRCIVRSSRIEGSVTLTGTVVVERSALRGSTSASGLFGISDSTVSGSSLIGAALINANLVDATIQSHACMHERVRGVSAYTFLSGECYTGTFPPPVPIMAEEADIDEDYSEEDDDYPPDNDDGDDEERGGYAARAATALDLKKGRLAGIEWEFNTYPEGQLKKWQKKWKAGIHEDGSCGSEAVTPPEAGKRREVCLSELGKILSTFEVNEKCGIHVHVDARDYYWADTYRLLRFYAHVEPLLYLLAGQRRTTNTYAAPVGNAFLAALKEEDPKKAILSVVHGGDGKNEQRFSPSKKASGRYKGLNLAPWVYGRRERVQPKRTTGARNRHLKPFMKVVDGVRSDSTFEFRLHENSQDSGRVIAWSNLCVDMVDFVVKMNDKQVADLCGKSPLRALLAASPESRAFVLTRIRQWRKALPKRSKESRRRIRVITATPHVWGIAS